MNMTTRHKRHYKRKIDPTDRLRDTQKSFKTTHFSEHLSVTIKHAIKHTIFLAPISIAVRSQLNSHAAFLHGKSCLV
jgi:hypothetical protein